MVYLLDFIKVYDFDSLESSSYFLLRFFLKARKIKLNIALAGGSTPLYLYKLMSNYKFPNFKFFLTDERYVPNNDVENNYHNISKFLNIEPVYKSGNIEKDCETFSNIIKKNPIHIALLGIGEDGHSASIFPDKNILKDCENTLISVGPSSMLRISLNFKALLNSQLIFFVSKSKKYVVSRLLREKNTVANEFISNNNCKKPILISDGMKDLFNPF
jgi:6-phosphogluconolactonase